MEREAERKADNLALWLLVLMVVGVLALVNIPPAAVSEHAVAKHGTQAENAVWEWENGACTEVWRSLEKRRIVRLVISDPLCAYGIVTTLAGVPCTAFYAPLAYWRVRLAGYDHIGTEGDCR